MNLEGGLGRLRSSRAERCCSTVVRRDRQLGAKTIRGTCGVERDAGTRGAREQQERSPAPGPPGNNEAWPGGWGRGGAVAPWRTRAMSSVGFDDLEDAHAATALAADGDGDGEHAGEELGPPEASRLRRGFDVVVRLVSVEPARPSAAAAPGGRNRRRGMMRARRGGRYRPTSLRDERIWPPYVPDGASSHGTKPLTSVGAGPDPFLCTPACWHRGRAAG